jgi:5-oxopent-3-ene-1,2,5-tricarboxylate decarboxylase/2-hydroxyhepta-2,4-diene-1,7-dioate isomerase
MKIALPEVGGSPLLCLVVGEALIDIESYARASSDALALDAVLAASGSAEMALTLALQRDSISGLLARVQSAGLDELEAHLIHAEVFYPPVLHPEKIIAIGLNYPAHAMEGGGYLPKEPLFFAKLPTCVTGSGKPILAPAWAGRIDPEGELAVIIGKEGRYISKEAAMDHVLGYSIINDVTARAMQGSDRRAGEPWLRSKSIDTFGPLGPYLVTKDEIPDPYSLDIVTTVNGEVRQKDNTRSLIFKVPELIAHVSRYIRLKAGDVIATGTPEGMKRAYPGDLIEITVAGLGTLRNRLMRDPRSE